MEQLPDNGHDVTVIDNLSSGSKEYVPDAVTFVEGDIEGAALVEEHVKGDVVFHLAANQMLLGIKKLQAQGWSPSMGSEEAVRQTTAELVNTLD